MPDVSVSVVSLLDASGSMEPAMPMVIIDGKAFVRSARPGDQIAVVQFQSSASMLYPATQTLATVDGQLSVTAAAAAAIGGLTSAGQTNMHQAVQIANNVLTSATLPTQAYMLLSDGNWNDGGDPAPVMPATPPIFICGLGPQMQQSYVQGMLNKNPASRYIASPNAWQMMQVFNTIRGLAAQATVARNQVMVYSGTDYTLTPVQVSSTTDEGQFTVVWSNANLSYTPGVPDATHVNIVLIDPNGASTDLRPVIADPGYAIFNVNAPQPGEWNVLSQYAAQSGTYATTAGFEFDTQLQLALDVPRSAAPGEKVTVRARLTDGTAPIESALVGVRLRAPRYDVARLLDQHATAVDEYLKRTLTAVADTEPVPSLRRFAALRGVLKAQGSDIDPFDETATFHPLAQDDDGSYHADLGPAPHGGDYTIEATARGYAHAAQTAFDRATMATIMVG
jgi:hypothetical protein